MLARYFYFIVRNCSMRENYYGENIFFSLFSSAEYGRTCKDIGCRSDEACVMAEDPCTGYSDKCGRYPTCRRTNGKEIIRYSQSTLQSKSSLIKLLFAHKSSAISNFVSRARMYLCAILSRRSSKNNICRSELHFYGLRGKRVLQERKWCPEMREKVYRIR